MTEHIYTMQTPDGIKIGFTTQAPQARWRQHTSEASKGTWKGLGHWETPDAKGLEGIVHNLLRASRVDSEVSSEIFDVTPAHAAHIIAMALEMQTKVHSLEAGDPVYIAKVKAEREAHNARAMAEMKEQAEAEAHVFAIEQHYEDQARALYRDNCAYVATLKDANWIWAHARRFMTGGAQLRGNDPWKIGKEFTQRIEQHFAGIAYDIKYRAEMRVKCAQTMAKERKEQAKREANKPKGFWASVFA